MSSIAISRSAKGSRAPCASTDWWWEDTDEGDAGLTKASSGHFELDLAAQRVRAGGREVRLTPMEFGVLALLAGEPGRTFTPQEILRQLWNSQYVGQHGACKTHVANLRHKLGGDASDPRRIVTVRGHGYVLRVNDEATSLDLVRWNASHGPAWRPIASSGPPSSA